ncbi:ricin B-like lectin [Cutaneotrichosporon oleaginosum]|uniref:Ricin B-like lectin n=1 Tax=Cutaneotrichosporon oleaginosum TaxID=879819 RepID=A0A0J1BEI3_9TREE|nr:ricin B-like lectin [Cutaneotrichosporon oleaginosum]KLT46524.1 ricin B-like lectin [Cutaneotrichosporon oleaginosum]TXT15109.1 hypothetical protein COLE_01302 [Cutaneotrichosporon oleaginosum]
MLAIFLLLNAVAATPIPDAGHALLRGTFGDATQCLAVKGGLLRNGSPVVITDCKDVPTQSWVVAHGMSGVVRVAGTRFCLDAGQDPKDGHKVHIQTCNPHLPQQNWLWTDDSRLQLVDLGLCLDNTDGKDMNGNQVQVWRCVHGNTNQIWGPPGHGACGAFPCHKNPGGSRPSHKPRPSHLPGSRSIQQIHVKDF